MLVLVLPREQPPKATASLVASADPTAPSDAPVVPPTASAAPRPALAVVGSADRGAALFGRSGCFVCHGPYAGGSFGPRIARTALPLDAVLSQVRRPRSDYMPAFVAGQLSDQAVADIYAFLQSLPGP